MNYEQFVDRLKESQKTVEAVGDYFRSRGYIVEIPKLVIAPHSVGSFSKYADNGDLFIIKNDKKYKIEVKHITRDLKDWQYSEMIVNSFPGYESKNPKPDYHIIVSQDMDMAAIIDKGSRPYWKLKKLYDSYKKQDLLFYTIPIHLVKFFNIQFKSNQMAKQIISISINLDKITQSKIYKGKKGNYLNATLFLNDEVDQYGNNGFIVEATTKEERESGVKGNILGNVKKSTGKSEEPQYSETLPF